jgi:hypothetical protein
MVLQLSKQLKIHSQPGFDHCSLPLGATQDHEVVVGNHFSNQLKTHKCRQEVYGGMAYSNDKI